MDRLYGVVFEVQQKEIGAYCWGAGCGKGAIGALLVDGFSLVPCREQECPYLLKQMDEPIGEVNGEQVYLRSVTWLEAAVAGPAAGDTGENR